MFDLKFFNYYHEITLISVYKNAITNTSYIENCIDERNYAQLRNQQHANDHLFYSFVRCVIGKVNIL